MRWLFITVSDTSQASRENLTRLLTSVESQGVDADLLLVMRGGEGPTYPPSGDLRIHVIASPLRIGLSRARNMALAYARSTGLTEDCDAVAFPDDDCRYPDGLLSHIALALAGSPDDIVCVPLAPSRGDVNARRYPNARQRLTPLCVMRLVSSGNVFLKSAVVRKIGDFDERFGLGAQFGAGEDSDYLLSALTNGYRGVYDPGPLVEHPYKPHRKDQYYPGNVAVLAKHARSGGTGLLLLRRVATGVLLLALRRLQPASYARIVVSALALLRTSHSASDVALPPMSGRAAYE